MTARVKVLVADDDPVARDLLGEVLGREGYEVRLAEGGQASLRLAAVEPFDLALVDLNMPDLDGLEVLKGLAAQQPGVPVLILTAFATMETAIEAIRAGAYDYLSKPFRMEEIVLVARRALEVRRLLRENQEFRRELQERYRVENLVGQSPAMVDVYKTVARVAPLDTTVLVVGETGTGKELVARAIHYAGPRAARPFVVVDCTALPEALFESEVFGHERGAFTGAVASRRGLLETADGGTVLLDEIGDLSSALQAKLLRVLQERAVRHVGGNEVIPVDVRVIAATHRDLRRRVDEGLFREDLYYRLNVVTVVVPPLRERRSDIPLLVRHFVRTRAAAAGKALRLAPETEALLGAYAWPGNVRELEHVVERALALASSELVLPEDLPPEIRAAARPEPALPGVMTLEELKRWYVDKVLAEAGGNKARAAALLGIDRRTLYRMLEHRPAAAAGNEGDGA
ncbi:MAG TPA: sigma-54 dependent transcriptional regulator [Methylomirabilota bacterium]|nr:sigma-54 dependent transcriptional regulator [Methylomirabilota bacterium]